MELIRPVTENNKWNFTEAYAELTSQNSCHLILNEFTAFKYSNTDTKTNKGSEETNYQIVLRIPETRLSPSQKEDT